ncbi:hypothetical protein GCM10027087_06150 [Paractinoplanes abujensis]
MRLEGLLRRRVEHIAGGGEEDHGLTPGQAAGGEPPEGRWERYDVTVDDSRISRAASSAGTGRE